MTKISTQIHESIGGHGKEFVLLAGILLLASVALLWGWNTIAGDLASLPKAQFRHAAAAVISLACLTWIIGHVMRFVSRS